MNAGFPLVAWAALAVTLAITSFGVTSCITTFFSLFALIIGGFTYLYARHGDDCPAWTCGARARLPLPAPGRNSSATIDQRLTGSLLIDQTLHIMLGYVIRDHITPWWDRLSGDERFPAAVRASAQKTIVSLAARFKDLDWSPYLTTKLVEDAATHLRLFRKAKAALRAKEESSDSPTGSPMTGGISKNPDLESFFFDFEVDLEKIVCRDLVSQKKEALTAYLQDISELILFLVLPPEDFRCKPLRLLIREILANAVLEPLVSLVSDPDYINQTIVSFASKEVSVTGDALLAVIRTSNQPDEVRAVLELAGREIHHLRSRDAGGESDAWVKAQLSSLHYLQRVGESRLQRISQGAASDTDSTGFPAGFDAQRLLAPGSKIFQLPLDVVLKNNIALSYFIDYVSSVGAQAYLFLYLNSEGWRAAAEAGGVGGSLKEAAWSIYEQYLSETASPRASIEESVLRRLILRLRTEAPSEDWFDEAQNAVRIRLEAELPGFRRSMAYLRLLAELDLLKDDDETSSGMSSGTDSSSNTLKAEIIETGLYTERGKTFGVYYISVSRKGVSWHVYRRYSDFHDLCQKVKDRYPDLAKLTFPAKKTFHNMDRSVLEKRMRMLNDYLQIILQEGLSETHPQLQIILGQFLEQGPYEKGGPLESLASSMRNVSHAADNLLSNLDGMVGNIGKVFQRPSSNTSSGSTTNTSISSASSNPSAPEDNIPLKIMLLLMDEVFDLKSRNLWLRRRIVTLLRTMFGDIVNRRILDYVAWATSPEQVADYLRAVKEAVWPHGARAEPRLPRDESTRCRTLVAAKVALLSSLSDELRHIIGSETTRRGLLSVVELFQRPVLNRRLLLVLIEGLISALFPEKRLANALATLHSRSPRVRDDFRTSQRSRTDLRR